MSRLNFLDRLSRTKNYDANYLYCKSNKTKWIKLALE